MTFPHIWIPNKKIIENTRELVLPKSRVSGRYTIVGRRPDGRERLIADHENLITDIGLDRWGVGSIASYCSVGSGSTTPTYSDSAMETLVAVHNSIVNTWDEVVNDGQYSTRALRVYRFNPPGANHNLSEVGVGWENDGSGLFSRSLIKNAQGQPTTVQWLADETLDVTYGLYRYPWYDDVPYTTTISGVEYTGIIRASEIDTASHWSPEINGSINIGYNPSSASGNYDYSPYLYNGSIGTNTSSPSGSYWGTQYGTSYWISRPAYVSGSYKRTGTFRVGPTEANLSGGITAIRLMNQAGAYQMSVSPAIPKVADYTLTLNFETPTWGRYIVS